MRVFISHSSKDSAAAEKACEKLEERGFPCFIAPRDIRSGCEYAEEIINGIDNSDIVVLLLSAASNSSPHVLREVERAVSKKKSIIVYKLEEVTLSKSLEYFLMTHQWVNTKPGRDFDEIVNRVSEFAAQRGGAVPAVPEENTQPPVKRRRIATIFVFAAAIVLVAAGVIAFCLSQSDDNQGDNGSSTDISSAADTQPQSGIDAPTETTDISKAETVASESVESVSSGETVTAEEVILPIVTEQTESEPQSVEQQPEEPQSVEPQPVEQPSVASVELGERITLGTYNGEPIEWRVINISQDKTKAVVISDKVLTMKAFDAAEGGSFNAKDGEDYWRTKTEDIDEELQRQIRGDNRWELSNIRTWLNSDKQNITYEGQAPISSAMSEKKNGYHTEAGFLNGFTDEELSAVAVTEVNTAGNVTEDKVFLLSSEELGWLNDADVSIYAKPTEAAVEQDKSKWYMVNESAYGSDDSFWWLREPNGDNACECLCVNISSFEQQTSSQYVGLEGYGIRPSMTLDLTSELMISISEN